MRREYEVINYTKSNGEVEDKRYIGFINGYMCGFNIEYIDHDANKVDFASCQFFYSEEELEDYLNDTRKLYWFVFGNRNVEFTGRIAFRGYYTEEYDWDEREEYMKEVSKETMDKIYSYMG